MKRLAKLLCRMFDHVVQNAEAEVLEEQWGANDGTLVLIVAMVVSPDCPRCGVVLHRPKGLAEFGAMEV